MGPDSPLDETLQRSRNQFGLSLLVILSWLASADGELTPEEARAIRAIGGQRNEPAEIDTALAVGAGARVRDLQLACELIRPLSRRNRQLFMQMAIGVALAEGTLAVPANHILRFLADLVGVGVGGLHAVFREMTGSAFPEPGDSSDPRWWEEGTRQRWRQRRRRREWRDEHRPPPGGRERHREAPGPSAAGPTPEEPAPAAADPQRLRDLAVLGIGEDATAGEIRMAYRRMAQIHHPDRFESLGPEAVKAAEATFKRVRAAYDRLRA